MVLAADDVGYLHFDVVANDRKIIERVAVGAEQDKVLSVGVIAFLKPVNLIVERGFAFISDFQPYGERLAGSRSASAFVGRKISIRVVAMFLTP